jgi:hypothetical protein
MVIIEIPNYIRTVKLSDKQNAKYFEYKDGIIKAGNKPLFQKYIKNEDKEVIVLNDGRIYPNNLKDCRVGVFFDKILVGYVTNRFDKIKITTTNSKILSKIDNLFINNQNVRDYYKFILVDNEDNKILANETQVGKPRIKIISGQNFYNSTIREFERGAIMNEIKKSFIPYVKDLPIIDFFPVRIKLYLFDTVKNVFDKSKEGVGQRWDVGNRTYPYAKAFLDLICTGSDGQINHFEPKLFDDDRLHVTEDPQGGTFCPIADTKDSKLVFVIAKDDENFHSVIKPIEDARQTLLANSKAYSKNRK